MTELLAPAGNMEALIAAISNGADAIYLGMNKFGARAYANNFDLEQLKEAIYYAHLRNVKIYVTMNTIVFDNELKDAYLQIDELYKANVDGVIVQDLAIMDYIIKNYPKMEAHCSTQMGIDDLEGTLLFKEMGAKRVVLSREVPIEKIKEIKKIAKLPIEIFVHGALCVSYSGNCLMSGLIGYRSGNRGRCVGSCRKPYDLINITKNEVIARDSYILSMKDLNTIDHINELKIADSLKIEGRMKEPVYVANVVSAYRAALDHDILKLKEIKLNKTFNRTFTKGYIFHEDKKNISNISRPNNFGYLIGRITKKNKLGYEIALNDELNQGDIIRIDNNGKDINLSVMKLYDKNDNLISSSNSSVYIKIKENLNIGDLVYKTKDIKYTDNLLKSYPKEFKRFKIDAYLYGDIGTPLTLQLDCDDKSVDVTSEFILEAAKNNPSTSDSVFKQLNRLNDTVYCLNSCKLYAQGVFIPAAILNELRRKAIELLNQERIIKRDDITILPEVLAPLNINQDKLNISVYCNTQEQYEAAKELGITNIYYKDNVIRRNENTYQDKAEDLLIGGYGGIYQYRKTNAFTTDFSLNAVNSKAVYLLHSLGAKRVCLSHEMNQNQINDLINSYYEKTNEYPNLEMIVYGRVDMMFTTYCPLKVFNQCGECKKNQYILKEEYGDFPIISHEDCTTTILNGKILNLIDDLESIKGINTFRVQLTIENKDEAKLIIKRFKDKINTMEKTKFFNKNTDTRGHFNKEIL